MNHHHQHRRNSDGSDSSMSSGGYDRSLPSTVPNSVPSLDHRNFSYSTPEESAIFESDSQTSLNTYCTTVASFDELDDDLPEEYLPHYSPYYQPKPVVPEAVPATPQEFAELFPSTRKLHIKHDDSTLDGNMNLRVDTIAPPTRRDCERRITLFHLRMYDLRDRDFSVRRYGRDCGREVAHVKRKVVQTHMRRPTLQRSVSRALNSFRGKHDETPKVGLDRQDSGYASGFGEDFDDDSDKEHSGSNSGTTTPTSKPTNTCRLEFSNYAHVDITRRGVRANKRYDFEYWGKSYSWKRTIKHVGLNEEVSYHLLSNSTGNVVAVIKPDHLDEQQAEIEERKGGFVPPCTMVLKHSTFDPVDAEHADVADVIVSTGLVALSDDCIKRKYHKKKTVQLVLPTPMSLSRSGSPLKMNMEYVGPKRFIDEVFNRTRPMIARSQSAQVGKCAIMPPPQRRVTH